MQKIYAVNAGSGSEYMVIALFNSMELAIEFMAVVSDINYNDVEVFELNPNAAIKFAIDHFDEKLSNEN